MTAERLVSRIAALVVIETLLKDVAAKTALARDQIDALAQADRARRITGTRYVGVQPVTDTETWIAATDAVRRIVGDALLDAMHGKAALDPAAIGDAAADAITDVLASYAARVDAARRDALTEAALALVTENDPSWEWLLSDVTDWLRARAAVESPDQRGEREKEIEDV